MHSIKKDKEYTIEDINDGWLSDEEQIVKCSFGVTAKKVIMLNACGKEVKFCYTKKDLECWKDLLKKTNYYIQIGRDYMWEAGNGNRTYALASIVNKWIINKATG